MALDLSSLKKAVSSLENALSVIDNPQLNRPFNHKELQVIKAGVVQNFEFTYELCWKFIQRWLKTNASLNDTESRTRKELFRLAARRQLINDPEPWFAYAEARNITAHTYDQRQADRVVEAARSFIDDAKALLKELEATND